MPIVEAIQKDLPDEREKFGEIFEEAEKIAEKLEDEVQLPCRVKISQSRKWIGHHQALPRQSIQSCNRQCLSDLESKFQSH